MDQQADIVETPVDAPEVVADAGVEPDVVVVNPAGVAEKIVYETDDSGNVTGWHKELV